MKKNSKCLKVGSFLTWKRSECFYRFNGERVSDDDLAKIQMTCVMTVCGGGIVDESEWVVTNILEGV